MPMTIDQVHAHSWNQLKGQLDFELEELERCKNNVSNAEKNLGDFLRSVFIDQEVIITVAGTELEGKFVVKSLCDISNGGPTLLIRQGAYIGLTHYDPTQCRLKAGDK